MAEARKKTGIRSFVWAMSIAAVFLIVLLAAAFYSYQTTTAKTIEEVSETYLQELADFVDMRLASKADVRFSDIQLIAEPLILAQRGGTVINQQQLQTYLSAQYPEAAVQVLGFLDSQGVYHMQDGSLPHITSPEGAQRLVAEGRQMIVGKDVLEKGLALDLSLNYFFRPIEPIAMAQGVELVAVMSGTNSETAERTIGDNVGDSEVSIIAKDGTFIVYPDQYESVANKKLFTLLETYATFHEGENIEFIKAALEENRTCLVSMTAAGSHQFLYFQPLSNTDLYICIAKPYRTLDAPIGKMSDVLLSIAYLLALSIIVLALVFSFFYFRSLRKGRKLLAEEKARAESASLQAQQANVAKSDFLSRMSHEIRTPLSGIIGMSDIALRNIDDSKKVMDSLMKVQISSKHLLSLINDILDMSKIESGKIEIVEKPFNIYELAASLDAFGSLQAKVCGITFETSVDDGLDAWLVGDELHINQVLYNLISNALKFTPKNGRVALAISKGEPPVHVEEDGGGGKVWIDFAVKDTGCGIRASDLDKIFRAFEQGNAEIAREHGGTGLGLAISRQFAEMMGGSIEVESEIDIGSLFTVRLPFKLTDEAAYNEEADRAPSVDRGIRVGFEPEGLAMVSQDYDFTGKRILVAEDNELNREIVLDLISSTGATVEVAKDGKQALDMFAESEPGFFDMVFMDIQMPRMDGCEATLAIRALKRPDAATVPILALSANAFDEDARRSLECGMNGHLCKPLDIRIIYKRMKEFLDSPDKDEP